MHYINVLDLILLIFQNGQHFRNDVIRPSRAEFCLALIHECLGGEEIGIDEAGKEEAQHEGHGVISDKRASQRWQWQREIEWDAAGLGVGEPFRDFFFKTVFKQARSIGEARVVAGDEIGNQRAKLGDG